MNIMRKLRGGQSGGVMASSSAGNAEDSGSSGMANPQHTALGLMHLKKLFSEYSHPAQPLSDAERDDKLYNMLPLFCKVRQPLIMHTLAQAFNYSHKRIIQFLMNINVE